MFEFPPPKKLGLLGYLARYYRTVSYLRWSQIRTRIFRKVLTELERLPFVVRYYRKPFPGPTVSPLRLPRLPLPDRHLLDNGEFAYIGKTYNCSVNWFPKGASLLWVFNLHYFDFLTELSRPEEKKRYILDWIAKVPVLHRSAWHPFPSSLRVCNWIAALPEIEPSLLEAERKAIHSSIYNQLRHIEWQLEEDLLANHLIENCRALIVAGTFLNEVSFIKRGLKVLLRELPEQILKDGGHYERSPQYHTAVLLALLDIFLALKQSGHELPPIIPESLKKMTEFLAKILDNGALPLLNDTSPEFVPNPTAVIELAARELGIPVPSYPELYEHLEDTGLFIVRIPRMALTFDVGPIGPDIQPGHAHSDTLSVLLTIDGVPILTDSGVYTYEPGPERDYFRSAFAHNGPIINGEDPNEMWGAFRVGRRVGRPSFRVIKDGRADGSGEWVVEGGGKQISRQLRIDAMSLRVDIIDQATVDGALEVTLFGQITAVNSATAETKAPPAVERTGEVTISEGEARLGLTPLSDRFQSRREGQSIKIRCTGRRVVNFVLRGEDLWADADEHR